jgi:hypothetical protein
VSVRERLAALASDSSEHEWVQARALGALARIDRPGARALTRARLGLGGPPREDWPDGLKGLGITFMIVGLMSLAFMSFSGIRL